MLTEGDHDKMRGFAPEPTERMTDERLAEIETALYEDTDLNKRYPAQEPNVTDCADELEALLNEAPKP